MIEATKESIVYNNKKNINTEDMEKELARTAKDIVKNVLIGLGNETEENKDSYKILDRDRGEEYSLNNKKSELDKDVTEYMCIEEMMEYTMERDDTKEIVTIVVAGISAVVTFLYYYF